MKEKQFDPAKHNEQSPAEGMASANTHDPEEKSIEETISEQKKEDDTTQQRGAESRDVNNKSAS